MSGLLILSTASQTSVLINQAYLWIEALKFDSRGLIPAIVQHDRDNSVRGLVWLDKTSVQQAFSSGELVASAHILKIKSIFYDCDRDALLIKVEGSTS